MSAGSARRRRRAVAPPPPTPAVLPAPVAAGLRWLRRIPHPLDAFLLTRLVLLLAGAVGAWLPDGAVPPGGLGLPLRPDTTAPWNALPSLPWLDGWARWDSAWYGAIAREGYSAHAGPQSAVAFFPLYPLLAKLLSLPVRAFLPADEAFYLAAIVLSHAAFFLGLHLFHRLARALLSDAAARRAVWLLCCFPFAFFFGAAYTESLFLLLVVGAFVAAREERWGWACAAACAAGLTRNVGAILVPALALEYLRQRDYDLRRLDRTALTLLIAPLGTVGYAAYLWAAFGDPLKFLHAQAAWGHKLALPPTDQMLLILRSPRALPHVRLIMASYFAIMVGFPALALLALRRFGLPLGLFAAGAVAAPLSAGLFFGMGRYMSIVFPAFLVLATVIRGRTATIACCVVGLAMAATFRVYFAAWWPPL